MHRSIDRGYTIGMDTKHVKNVSGVAQTVIGVGICQPNDTIEVPADFHNANFEDVEKKTSKNKEDKKETKAA